MKLRVRDKDDVVVFDVSGRIMGGPDADTFQSAVKEQIEQGKTKFIVNLADTSWINSTGLGILIAGFTSVKRAGGALKLMKVPSRIESVLMITKLLTVFETYTSEDEAIASFQTQEAS